VGVFECAFEDRALGTVAHITCDRIDTTVKQDSLKQLTRGEEREDLDVPVTWQSVFTESIRMEISFLHIVI